LSSTGECFDIGLTVRQALADFLRNGEPFAGSTNRYSAGNGSMMRLAPSGAVLLPGCPSNPYLCGC
jgi:ADP-ribosyl-[dinitrogen reductase] hydrolase